MFRVGTVMTENTLNFLLQYNKPTCFSNGLVKNKKKLGTLNTSTYKSTAIRDH